MVGHGAVLVRSGGRGGGAFAQRGRGLPRDRGRLTPAGGACLPTSQSGAAASCQTPPESIGLSPTSRVGHCPTPTCFPSKVALPEGRMWPNRQRNGSVTLGHVRRSCSLTRA